MEITDFEKYLKTAWDNHVATPEAVFQNLMTGIKLVQNDSQIPSMARLITHVAGEHSGQWERGILLLKELQFLTCYGGRGTDSEKEIRRSTTSLQIAAGKSSDLQTLNRSDQIRALAVAAAALSGQKLSEKAKIVLHEALEKAALGLPKDDPANRALAVAANNLAGELEEKKSRNKAERELMILAAESARKYWEIAGSWLECERAEYRLAMTYLKAEDFGLSLTHAKQCQKIIRENGSDPVELFFAYEAIALAEKALGHAEPFAEAVKSAQDTFAKIPEDLKVWCRGPLDKILGAS